MDTYIPIAEYGLIGNLETCALLGQNGSIDWACFPDIDSPRLFAGMLDAKKGGHFSINPIQPFESTQPYLARTNILQTTFQTVRGEATVTDFMPIVDTEDDAPPCERSIKR